MDTDTSPAIDDMLQQGVLTTIPTAALDVQLQNDGLTVLFFSGGPRRVREAHDVAVALREILKDYPSLVQAVLIDVDEEKELQSRFRVLTSPALVFVAAGNTLEVIPGVRDWADYSKAFSRYLGASLKEAMA